MSQILFMKGFSGEDVTPPRKEIKAAAAAVTLAPAKPGGPASYVAPYANASQNSRVNGTLAAAYRQRWSSAFPATVNPVLIYAAANRVLLLRENEWELLDAAGKRIFGGTAGSGPVLMDAERELFFRMAPSSYLTAASLTDGQQRFLYLPTMGDVFRRTFLAGRGNRVILAGQERALNPHENTPPSRAVIEALDASQPFATSGMGELTNAVSVGELYVNTLKLLVAANPSTIVAATLGCVYIADWDLQVTAALEGDFRPLLLSLDEAGRIYLVAESKRKTVLWLITPQGERLYAFEFPPGIVPGNTPPVVGFDHTTYLLAGQHLLAVAPDGKLEWSKQTSGPLLGAVATPDRLLLAEGNTISAWRANGERTVLYTAPETLNSAPILTESGDLLVASRTQLYCLKPDGAARKPLESAK